MEALDRTSRGDLRGYLRSLVVASVSVAFLLCLYQGLDAILMDIWGARSGQYLDTYRTWGAKIWRILHRSSSSWLYLWLPILWLLSMFLIQAGLKKDYAKRFNKVHFVLLVVVSVVAVVSFFKLMLMPIGIAL